MSINLKCMHINSNIYRFKFKLTVNAFFTINEIFKRNPLSYEKRVDFGFYERSSEYRLYNTFVASSCTFS